MAKRSAKSPIPYKAWTNSERGFIFIEYWSGQKDAGELGTGYIVSFGTHRAEYAAAFAHSLTNGRPQFDLIACGT